MNSIREKLAEYSHDQAWSGWMKYMFDQGEFDEDGNWVMPAEKVKRWSRQMNTAYSDLPDHERESDRAEADKMLAIISQ